MQEHSSDYKVLFIIPQYYSDDDMHKPVFTVPYGILSIDAYMKKNSSKQIKSKILDLNIKTNINNQKSNQKFNQTLWEMLQKFNPDIVAISSLFDTQYRYLNPISSLVKNYSDKILVVAGGGLPTNLYKKILKECPCIDAICYGEGEIPMTELINSVDHDKLIERHTSWINRKKIAEKSKPLHSFVYNLDNIPEFDYSIIDLDNYNSRSLHKDNNSDNKYKREISIHTSRGCPFDCIFCSNGKLHGKKIRLMSIERIIIDVKNMIEKYGLTTLIIEDDNFLFNKERAKIILKRLSQLNINIEFPNGLMVNNIDDEMGQLLREAGTRTIPLAIESGSDYILQNIIRKPLTVKNIKPVVDILRKNDIRVHAFIVLGIPGETDKHRLETIKALQNIGFDWVHIFIAIPVSGSRLYDICIKNNYLIKRDMNEHNISKANIRTPDIEPKYIENYSRFLNIYINFINNYNMRIGNYDMAKKYFDNVIKKYPDNILARHFLFEVENIDAIWLLHNNRKEV